MTSARCCGGIAARQGAQAADERDAEPGAAGQGALNQ